MIDSNTDESTNSGRKRLQNKKIIWGLLFLQGIIKSQIPRTHTFILSIPFGNPGIYSNQFL